MMIAPNDSRDSDNNAVYKTTLSAKNYFFYPQKKLVYKGLVIEGF